MEAHPARTVAVRGAEAGAAAKLLACRLAGLSALEAHYAGQFALRQTEPSVAPPSVKNIDRDKRTMKAIRAAATTASAAEGVPNETPRLLAILDCL
jgi:hypothetical protein